MNVYSYTIDVTKLGGGDVLELMEGLRDFNPDVLTLDFLDETINFAVHGDGLDKIAIEKFLKNYTDLKWECEEED